MRLIAILLTIVNLFMCLRAYIKGCYSWEIGVSTTVAVLALIWYLKAIKK